jgi:hypothetical protein
MTAGRWAVAAASLSVCCSCSGDDASNRQLYANEVAQLRVVDTNMALPSSSTNVWRHELSFQDAVQYVRFDAEITEAREFAGRALSHPLRAGKDPHVDGELSRHWWLQRFPPNGEGGSAGDFSRSVRIVLEPRGHQARVWLAVAAD